MRISPRGGSCHSFGEMRGRGLRIGAVAAAVAAGLVLAASGASWSSQESSDVVAGLQRVASLSGQLETLSVLGRPLALTSATPGGTNGLGLGDALQAATTARVANPQSLSDLASQLTTPNAVDLGSGRSATIAATAVPASAGSTVDGLNVTVTITRHEASAPLALSSATPLLTLTGSAAAALDLSLAATLRLRYDTVTRNLWLDAPQCKAPGLSIDATVSALPGAGAGLGVLGVKLAAPGSGALLSSTTHVLVQLGTPDSLCRVILMAPNGSGTEAPSGLSTSGLSADFAPSPASTIQGAVTVSADVSGWSGLASLQSASGTLSVSDNDLANGTPPTVSTQGLGSLEGFSNLAPNDLASGLGRLSLFVRQAEQATIPGAGGRTLGDLPLPFMKGRLSDTFQASEVIDQFLSQHAPQGQPDFASVQQMLTELAATSVAGASVSVDSLQWSPSAAKLSFGLHVQSARTGVPLDPVEGGAEDPHVGEVDFGSALTGAAGFTGLAAIHAVATGDPSYQLDVTPTLDLAPPRSDLSTLDRFMVRTGSSLLSADVPITSAIDATGQTGALQVHAGGTLDFAPPAGGHMLELTLPKTGDANGDLSLPAALALLGSAPGDLLSASNGGSATAALGIDIPDAHGFFGAAGCVNEQVPGCTDATVSWPDVTNPSTLSVTGAKLGTLKAFDFATGDPKDIEVDLSAGLHVLADSFGKLSTLAGTGAGALNTAIPLLGNSFASLIDPSALRQALSALDGAPQVTLADVASTLNNALGAGSSISFAASTDSVGTPLLLAHLQQHVAIDRTVPLDLELGLSAGAVTLAGASSSGRLHLSGGVDYDVTLALPIADRQQLAGPSDIRVLPSSKISGQVTADGSGTLAANLGPFVVELGAQGDPSVLHAAVDLSVSDPSPGSDPVSFSDWAAALTPQLNQTSAPVTCGQSEAGYGLDICAELPVYLSNDGGHTFSKISDTGNNDLILRLPASDPTFDPGGDPIDGPQGLPALDRIVLPDGLDQALLSAILSFDSLQAGADTFLGLIQQGLGAASDNGKLPFVGSDLQEGQQFVQNLQTELDNAFAALPPLGAVGGLKAADIRADIQNALSSALGSTLRSSVTVGLACAAGPCADDDFATAITSATISFDAGANAAAFSTPLRIGIPGLSLDSNGTLSGSLGWTLHVALGVDRQGFFLQPGNRLSVGLTVDAPTSLAANLGALQVDLTDLNGGSVPAFSGTASVALDNAGNEYLGDLVSNGSSLVAAHLTAHVKADWHARALAGSALPGLSADFHLDWDWPDSSAPTVLRFNNISVVPGDLVQGVLGPVAREVNGALGPIQPFLDDLTQPLPVVSDLPHDVGGGDITVTSLLGIAANLSGDQRLEMAQRIEALTTIINKVSEAAGSNQPIPIGSFDVNPQAAVAGDAPDQLLENMQPDPSQNWSDLTSTLVGAMFPGDTGMLNTLLNEQQGGFTFPVFDHPSQLLGLLLGQDVDVVKYDAGTLQGDLGPPLDGLSFPSNDAVPIDLGVTGDLTFKGYFIAGFDTYGIRQALQHGQAAGILNGFYVSTRDQSGQQAPNLQLDGNAYMYGGVNAGLASADVHGGIFFDTTLGLYDPTNTGKFRPSKFADLVNGPGCVFVSHLNSYAYLSLSATLGISPVSKTWTFDLAKSPLFDLNSICQEGSNDEGIQFGGGGVGFGSYVPRPPVRPLGTVQTIDPGRDEVGNAALNDQGQVLWGSGRSVSPTASLFLWQNGHSPPVGTSPPLRDNSNRLNDAGQLLLQNTQTGVEEVRRTSGELLPLPAPPVQPNTPGLLSNPTADCTPTVYQWTNSSAWAIHGDAVTPLPDAAAEPVQPMALSRSGILVGAGTGQLRHGYELVSGAWSDLNDRPHLPAGFTIGQPFAVNDNGDVLADAAITVGNETNRGLVLEHGDGSVSVLPQDLQPINDPEEEQDSWVLNDEGDIITNGQSGTGVYHDGRVYDLRSLIDPNLGYVKAINDNGQILGVDNGGNDSGTPVLITIPSWAKQPAAVPVAECPAPDPPTHLRAVASGSGTHLSWQSPENAVDITSYHVYRYTDPTHLVHVADVDGTTTTYVDTSPPSRSVHYAVSAEGPGGEGNIALSALGEAAARTTTAPGAVTVLPLPNGHGTLRLPADLASSPTTFTYIEPAAAAPEAGEFVFAGQTFTISATDSSGQAVHTFAHPYTLTVSYDPSKLPPNTDESKLNLRFYDGSAWQPTLPCSGCSLDTGNHTITVVLDHLTTFALLVPAAAHGSNGGSGGSGVPPAGGSGSNPGAGSGNSTGSGGTPPAGGGGGGTLAAPVSVRAVRLDYSALHRARRLGVTLANPNSFATRATVALAARYRARLKSGSEVDRRLELGRISVVLRAGARQSVVLAIGKKQFAQLLAGRRQVFFLMLTTSAPSRPATTRTISIHLPLSHLRS